MNLAAFNLSEKLIYATSLLVSKWINNGKKLKESEFKNILVFKLDEIGDLCYSLHVFDLLKIRYPGAKITLVCKPYCLSLVNSHPAIDKVLISMEKLNEHFDLIVDLRGNWKTILFAITHKPKARLDRGTVRFKNKKLGSHPHEVFTNTQIIAPVLKEVPEHPNPQLFLPQESKIKVQEFIADKHLTKYAVLHCGARRELRRWPASAFAALSIWLKKSYQMEIIFSGDAGDLELVQSIQKQIPFATFNTCQLFNLTDFGALVQTATLYIGNESGPLCIAAISGAPSLGLFGPGEPNVFYPYGKKIAYIHHVLECNPCDQIHCVHPDNPCIQRITLQEVKAKVNELMALH